MSEEKPQKYNDKRPLPRQHRRCPKVDYHGRRIYMVTLCTEGRHPLLGELIGDSPETAAVEPSPLGLRVVQCWKNIPLIQKQLAQKKAETTGQPCRREISLIDCQLMPDHFHGILFVHSEMDISLGDVIRGFMTGCTKAFRELQDSPTEERRPLWERGFHDRVLSHSGQLQNMINYVRDNPRRLWQRRHNPELFRLHRQTEVRGLTFTSLGNHFLLDWPVRQLVEMSRSASEEQIEERLQEVLAEARNGAVTYTAAISQGEKLIARTLREQGFPLVVLLCNGFPAADSPEARYFKPGGPYFEACADGRMLLLEPSEAVFQAPAIVEATNRALLQKSEARHTSYSGLAGDSQRYRFVALNQIGRWLAEER